MRTLLLGIDIGTSACKVAAFLPNGEVVATAAEAYSVYYPQEGWAEQSPEEWWQAVCRAVQSVFAEGKVLPAEIAAVGIDGQSWSAIPVTADGEVLHRTPIWTDTRSQSICDAIRAQVGADTVFEICGNPLQPTYTLPKILWFRENCPEVYRRADKILQSNSYIGWCLTGKMTQDISQCYGLQCYDIRKGIWNDALCSEIGLNRDLLPEIVPCHQIIGTVTEAAARLTGLLQGTPVVAGGLDAACGTLGVGVIENGQTQEQGGQAGGMSICMDSCLADPRLILGNHVVPGKWLLQGGTVGGGGMIRWFEEQFCETERQQAAQNGRSSYQEMDLLAQEIAPGSEGVLLLPYMAGERSPIWNGRAKGVFYGLDYSKTRAHMIRACMEGVAFSLQHNLMAAKEAGAEVQRLRAMGGAANSRVWMQIKSDVTGKPVDVPTADTASTFGAAILAGVGAGVYQSFDSAVQQGIKIRKTYSPNPENHEIYQAAFEKYLELYEALKPLMK